MPEDPSDDGHAAGPSLDDDGEVTVSVDETRDVADAVDDDVQRRLREAYLNDEESVLVVTAVRSTERRVAVELRPPHGGATHVERFRAPRDGSLRESEALLAFLDAAGVSPLDVDELVGRRIPATYDGEDGWRLDEAYVGARDEDEREGDAERGRLSASWNRTADWLWTYRYWVVAVLLVGGELAFVAVIILLFG